MSANYNPGISQTEVIIEGARFTQFTERDGLPNASIKALLEDKNGFLWIGTNKGLVRYDGYEFYTFLPDSDHPNGLKGSNINSLYEDQNGYLWIGTATEGLNVYIPETDKFYNITYESKNENTLSHYEVTSISGDSFGDIYINLGYSMGLNRLKLGIDKVNPLANVEIASYLPVKLPVHLYYLVDSLRAQNRIIGELLKVKNNEDLHHHFTTSHSGKYLVLALGEKGYVTGSNWLDYGWIESESGEVIWRMDISESLHAGGWQNGALRVQMDVLDLNAGQFTLRYYCDNYRAFGEWDNIEPDRPDYYGIQIIKLTDNEFIYFQKQLSGLSLESSILDSHVSQIIRDDSDQLWLGSAFGLTMISPSLEELEFSTYYADVSNVFSLPISFSSAMAQRRSGGLWISGMNLNWDGGAICYLDTISDQFMKLDVDIPQGNWVNSIYEDSKENLWISTSKDGLYRIDPYITENKNSGFQQKIYKYRFPYSNIGNEQITSVNSIIEDQSNIIWIGTSQSGLYKYDDLNNQLKYYPLEKQTGNQVDFITAVAEISFAEIWFGTRNGQIYIFDTQKRSITELHDLIGDQSFQNSASISSIHVSQSASVWIGTQGNGLFEYVPDRNLLNRFKYLRSQPEGLCSNFINAVSEDSSGLIWVATQTGINNFDGYTGIWQSFHPDPAVDFSISHDNISGIFEDRQGVLWFHAKDGGINRLLKNQKGKDKSQFQWKYYLSGQPVYDIIDFEDHKWAVGYGLHRISESLIQNQEIPIGRQGLLEDRRINDVFIDQSQRLWIATDLYGLYLVDSQVDSILNFTTKDGLTDQTVKKIWSDENGYIWLLHPSKGISKMSFNSKSEVNFIQFGQSRGLILTDNFYLHCFQASNGYTILTHGKGFYYFKPSQLQEHQNPPTVVLTNIQVYDESLKRSKEIKLNIGIDPLKPLLLNYWQRELSLSYTALHLDDSGGIRYKYKCEGLNEDWVNAARERVVRFGQIPPGKYTFHVIASNSDGFWNEHGATLHFKVLPPWWKQSWAYGMYFLAVTGLFFGWRRYDKKRIQLQQELEMKDFEAQKLEELVQMKSNFYTSISHEFRTPITIILGMADQILQKPAKKIDHALDLIKRNGKLVLNLVNQLLDLSRLESGSMQLQYVKGDLLKYLRYLTESYRSFAATKKIIVRFECSLDSLVMDYDPVAMQKIISNLMGNAIKFTGNHGEVILSLNEIHRNGDTAAVIAIQDNGIGIPESEINHIFDRYYRVDSVMTRASEGTGIGLSLVKELVERLEGKIEVNSALHEGTVFTIWLPVKRQADTQSAEKVPGQEIEFYGEGTVPMLQARPVKEGSTRLAPFTPEENSDTILIVEDNPDVVEYLTMLLEGSYHILIGNNGREGIDLALEHIPDLVVSDVMMPEVDGLQLCETLKTNEKTSHIPIIILTAKATVEDRISGLERGADAYLAKPFIQQELVVRIIQLLDSRKKIQKYFSSPDTAMETEKNELKRENIFLNKVRELVEENFESEDFGPAYLEKSLLMSRTQLYRKVKALTGRSVSLYIRLIRLQKARVLLRTEDLSVSEVAYQVGFKNPSHFSRYFHQEFGTKPSEAR